MFASAELHRYEWLALGRLAADSRRVMNGQGMAHREPADDHKIIQNYADWLSVSELPKLLVNTTAGHALIGPNREFCRTWPNQTEITVAGKHYYQEDAPHELGRALDDWYASIPPL